MSEKLRVGVIGCGGMSRNHVAGYLNCGRYQIVSLADLEEGAMRDMDAQFDITTKHYTDARAMLEARDETRTEAGDRFRRARTLVIEARAGLRSYTLDPALRRAHRLCLRRITRERGGLSGLWWYVRAMPTR